MARPKMTVAAALIIGRAMGNSAAYPIEQQQHQQVMGFTGVSPGDVGAKQAVKVGNGSMAPTRATSDRTGVEDDYERNNDDRFHSKALQAGDDSSSVKLESPAEVLADFEQHPCVTPWETQNFGNQELGGAGAEGFMCTACGYSVKIAEVRAHPVLHVGVCGPCYEFLFSSPFTKDNPQDPSEHENECRWCGDGGEIVLCDTCPKAFCKPCIKRNFGVGVLNAIETLTRQWRCFVCDDNLLQTLIREYKNLQTLVKTKTTMNRNGPPPKRRMMREPFPRPRGSSNNKTSFPEDTIAAIIAREKAKLQRKHPKKRCTGFEVPNQRRQQQSRHSLFARTRIKTEQGTSNQSSPISEVNLL